MEIDSDNLPQLKQLAETCEELRHVFNDVRAFKQKSGEQIVQLRLNYANYEGRNR